VLGSCRCGNIELHWQLVDRSLVPRCCQCEYCVGKALAWVSKSGTRLRCAVHRSAFHRTVTHGTQTARFHECTYCDMPVFASSEVDGDHYAVVNAACMQTQEAFVSGRPISFADETLAQRETRRKANWCMFDGLQFMDAGKQ